VVLDRRLGILVGGQINSTIQHAAAEHGHPEAKSVGGKTAQNPYESLKVTTRLTVWFFVN